jgi:hypothetical protein
MTLFYMSPNDDFPNPPKGLAPEDIAHKKILDNWFAFTETLEPEFSKLTFFPENILPHEKAVYLNVFIKEFKDSKKLGALTPEILNALAINICNLFRFSSLIDKGIHKIYAQKILDCPEGIEMFDKTSLLDTYLQQSLTENIFNFCEQEGFPKEIMYNSNFMFLSTSNEAYNNTYKSKFLKNPSDAGIANLENSSGGKNGDDFYQPEGTINKYAENNKMSFYIVGLILFALMVLGVIVQIPK